MKTIVIIHNLNSRGKNINEDYIRELLNKKGIKFFYFQTKFETTDFSKVIYLFFIIGNSIFVYFLMSNLFNAFSIKDFKLKNYK